MMSTSSLLRFGSESAFFRRIRTGVMLAVAFLCSTQSQPAAAAGNDIEEICEQSINAAKSYISTASAKDPSYIVAPLKQCMGTLKTSLGPNDLSIATPSLYLGILLSIGPSDTADEKRSAQGAFSQALAADPTIQLPKGLEKNTRVKYNFDFAVLALSSAQTSIRNKPQQPVTVQPAPPAPQPPTAPAPTAPKWIPGEPEVEVSDGEEIDVDGKTDRWVPQIRVRYQTGHSQQERIAWLMAEPKSYGITWAGQIPRVGVQYPSVRYVVEILDEQGRILVVSAPVVVRVKAPHKLPAPDVTIAKPQASTPSIRRFFFAFGAGTLAAVVPGGTPTDVAWSYRPTGDVYDRIRLAETGTLWGGVAASVEFGGFVTKHIALSVTSQMQVYLPSNVQSAGLDQFNCTNDQGFQAGCYATIRKSDTGVTILGRFKYQFRPTKVFQPYIFAEIGGGVWRAAQSIDSARPQRAGAYDPSSPYQLTDECSANFDGNSVHCSGASGKLGYNAQNPALRNPPTALNVVCDPSGSCIDTVSLGNFLLGTGAGFYLGGENVGVVVEGRILGAFRSGLSTLVVGVQTGLQVRF